MSNFPKGRYRGGSKVDARSFVNASYGYPRNSFMATVFSQTLSHKPQSDLAEELQSNGQLSLNVGPSFAFPAAQGWDLAHRALVHSLLPRPYNKSSNTVRVW